MNIPEKLATLSTYDTERKKKAKTATLKTKKMSNTNPPKTGS